MGIFSLRIWRIEKKSAALPLAGAGGTRYNTISSLTMATSNEFVLFITIPDYAPRCYRLRGDRVKIGRGQGNHLTLDYPAISSSHCEFIKNAKAGTWSFKDLDSTNGSKSNGHRVTSEPVPARDGDQIVLGAEIKLSFCEIRDVENLKPKPDPADPALAVNPVAAAMARQVREDEEGGQTVRLNK